MLNLVPLVALSTQHQSSPSVMRRRHGPAVLAKQQALQHRRRGGAVLPRACPRVDGQDLFDLFPKQHVYDRFVLPRVAHASKG